MYKRKTTIYKNKDRVTRTPLKTRGGLSCLWNLVDKVLGKWEKVIVSIIN